MSLLRFFGGDDSNANEQMNAIGDRQYGLAQGYRNTANDYRLGNYGKQLYQRNQIGANSLLGNAYNRMQRDLASRGINSSALNKQNLMEFQGQSNDQLFNANLDSWGKMQDMALQYEGLGGQYEGMGNQSKAMYGQGRQNQIDSRNSFLNSTLGLVGGLASGGAFNGLGGLLGQAWDTVGGWFGGQGNQQPTQGFQQPKSMYGQDVYGSTRTNRLGTWGTNNNRIGNLGRSNFYGRQAPDYSDMYGGR